MLLKLILMFKVASVFLQVEATHLGCVLDQVSCSFYDKGSFERNRTTELNCCNLTAKNYYQNWDRGSHYLSTFLQTLKTWECPQFAEECARRTFAYNQFTRLLYSAYCNLTELEEKCYDHVLSVVKEQNSERGSSFESWIDVTKHLDLIQIRDEDLSNPCVQVAMLDVGSNRFGRFHELITPLAPLCEITWCGFDEKIISTRDISIWTCMPSSCHVSIIVAGVVCGLLAIATTICNVLVLIVFGSNKNKTNATTVYKMSIAFADFLVGVIVFPTFISTMATVSMKKRTLGDARNVTAYVPSNSSNGLSVVSFGEIHEATGGLFCDRIPQSYLNAVGFFTTLSLTVSIYCLTAASVDRFTAVYRPMEYQQYAPASAARKAVIGIWIFALLFSTAPFYVNAIQYRLMSIFVASGEAQYVYLVAFVLPLLVMWGLSLATYCAVRVHNKQNAVLKTAAKDHKKTNHLEMRLARTLVIMVGVFTLCLFPVVLGLLIPEFLLGISVFDPKNLNPKKLSSFQTLEVVLIIVLTSNSLWNFFIYCGRDKRFREATKELLGRFKRPVPYHGIATTWTNLKTPSSRRKLSNATTGIPSSVSTNANHSNSPAPRATSTKQ